MPALKSVPVKDFSPDEIRRLRRIAFNHAEGVIEAIASVAKGEKSAKNGQVNAARVLLERVLPAVSVSMDQKTNVNVTGDLNQISRETLEKLVQNTLAKGELSDGKDREILDLNPEEISEPAKSQPEKST